MGKQGKKDDINTITAKPNALGNLPVELLNESFSYLNPIDLLAVAMTSKPLCHILTDPKSNFVWKRSRCNLNLTESVPDPTPNWTEPAYAHFLFKPKRCTECKEVVHSPPFSFACRVFLCNKHKCILDWATKYTKTPGMVGPQRYGVLGILPEVDVPTSAVTKHSSLLDGPQNRRWLTSDFLLEEPRFAEMSALNPEHEMRRNYVKEMTKRKKRMQTVMKWASETQKWAEAYERKRSKVLGETKSTVMSYTAEQGWDLYCVRFSPTLVSLRRKYERALVGLPVAELRKSRHAIELDLQIAVRKAAQRDTKDASALRKLATERVYSAISDNPVIPHKAEFKRLAAITMLQSLDWETIESFLNSGDLLRTTSANLDIWRQSAKEKFGAKLGNEGWISISSKQFHPAERPDAFFQCTKCRRVPERCAIYGAITFQEACRHVCRGLTTKQREQAPWDPDMFEVDQKAIAVAQKALAVTSCDAAFYSIKKFEDLKHLFICKSCSSLIAMDFQSVIGHCKRHEDMQVELVLPGTEGDILYHPIKYGLVAESSKVPAGAERKFGCRHCGQKSTGKYGFHGLISHLKSKHKVVDVRDEDIFLVKGLESA